MVDREGCHGDHVGSQLNKCWQELEQPLRHRHPSLLALLVYVNEAAPLFLSLSWHERVWIVARVVQHAKLELDSPRVRFIRATLTHKSYTELRLFNAKWQTHCTHITEILYYLFVSN